MPVTINILKRDGWDLNPDDKVVNNIFRALERCDGHCPCHHEDRRGNDVCPCDEYKEYNNCVCGLYTKRDEDSKS